MIVKPKVRGFICTTAHPTGCAGNVRLQAEYVKKRDPIGGPGRVLVIGSSTGYGLACRIAATFGCNADTVGVFFEKPPSGSRTATAGWYNNRAFEALAAEAGRAACSINGDAYSREVKEEALSLIKKLPGGQVDLVIYSLAAPRRTDYETGQVYNSVIKPLGEVFRGKTVDVHTGAVTNAEIQPATLQEAEDTVAVMGGEDWLRWIRLLQEGGALAPGAATIAFSYIGPTQTHAIYKNGTIGRAKEDLEAKAEEITRLLSPQGGRAFVSVNKALVTQASAAIPVVPLYMSLLYKVMKARGVHEGCIQQMDRMLRRLYPEAAGNGWDSIPVDEGARIRMDDWEMEPTVQQEVQALWKDVSSDNIRDLGDLDGYLEDFYQLFGFRVPGVDYDEDVELG